MRHALVLLAIAFGISGCTRSESDFLEEMEQAQAAWIAEAPPCPEVSFPESIAWLRFEPDGFPLPAGFSPDTNRGFNPHGGSSWRSGNVVLSIDNGHYVTSSLGPDSLFRRCRAEIDGWQAIVVTALDTSKLEMIAWRPGSAHSVTPWYRGVSPERRDSLLVWAWYAAIARWSP